jgi:chromate transporter
VFARYANATFGGGSATTAVLREQIVTRRAWLTERDFELAYALSRLTPGTNLLAFCTAAGWMTRGLSGAIVALLASSIPCSLVALVATCFYELGQASALLVAAARGALAAAVAIMVNTAWVFARPHAMTSRVKALVIVLLAFLLVTGPKIAPLHVLLGAAAVGFLWPAREERP